MTGSDPSFTDWVEARAPALSRFALLVAGSRSAGDDALQEALTRAYPRWSRICGADDPEAYVRRMIVNAHISWWRRTKHEDPVAEMPPVAHTPSSGLDNERLWRLCLALPQRQRAVVVLRYYEGYSYAEVAAVLGVAEVTARTQTHRALATLRAALEEDDHG